MTSHERLDEIHTRVTAWSERVEAEKISLSEMLVDPEFVQIIEELMEVDMDDLMVLVGRSLQEANVMPDWLKDLPDTEA